MPAAAPEPAAKYEAEGLWIGKTSDNRTLYAVVLNDGKYYIGYSAAGGYSYPIGFLQGAGTAKSGSFSSADLRDFDVRTGDAYDRMTLSATYRERTSFDGTISGPKGGVSFTSSYSPEYDKTPSLSSVAGKYSMDNSVLNIAGDGKVSVVEPGWDCSVTGSVSPRGRGNVYDASISQNGKACTYPGLTATGVAFIDPDGKRLHFIVLSGDRTTADYFLGVKQ